MPRAHVYATETDPAQHFTQTLESQDWAFLNLPLASGLLGSRQCQSIVRQVAIVSVQRLSWEVVFFRRRRFRLTPLGQNDCLGRCRLSGWDAYGFGYGRDVWHYQATHVDLAYLDLDFEDRALAIPEREGFLHVVLVNRSSVPKYAGDTGAVKVTVYLEST